MTTTQTPFNLEHPAEFLMEIFLFDPVSAVKIANIWGANSRTTTREQYRAAFDLIQTQTVVPRCSYCTWALFENEPHDKCGKELDREMQSCGVDEDDLDDGPEDDCRGGCGQPESQCTCAEMRSWQAYCATPLELREGPWTA